MDQPKNMEEKSLRKVSLFILCASLTEEGEQLAKSELSTSYEIRDIGEAKLILGMHIKRNKTTDNITLSQ